MIELEFIPLKTQEGVPCGHARVRRGYVDVCVRGTARGQALILTDGGCVTGASGTRVRVDGRVRCVALHEGNSLLGAGFARGSSMTMGELRRRIASLAPEPKPKPARAPIADTPSAINASPAKPAYAAPAPRNAMPAPDANEPARAPVADAPTVEAAPNRGTAPDREAAFAAVAASDREAAPAAREEPCAKATEDDALPAHESIFDTQRRLSREGGAFLPSGPMGGARDDEAESAEPAEPCDAADEPYAQADRDDSASLSAQLRRAEAVLRRISSPCRAVATPSDGDAHAETDAPIQAPAPRVPRHVPVETPDRLPQDAPQAGRAPSDARDAWRGEVDELLSRAGTPQSLPIENPFPHIFPGAVFARACDARGGEALHGLWTRRGERFHITAVRGEYRPHPPAHLSGFTRYIRTAQGGYWVKVSE